MDIDLDYTALLVIDAIDAVPEGEDTVYANELSPEMAAFRANVAEVVELAHENGIPVLFCNDGHIEGLDQELELWGPHGIKGKTRIFPEIDVEDYDLVIPKRRYSAFFQTDLELTLSEIGADTLFVVGCDTNVCVLHTGILFCAFGWWRSLVAHLTGGQGVAGSNPVHPTRNFEVRAYALAFFVIWILCETGEGSTA